MKKAPAKTPATAPAKTPVSRSRKKKPVVDPLPEPLNAVEPTEAVDTREDADADADAQATQAPDPLDDTAAKEAVEHVVVQLTIPPSRVEGLLRQNEFHDACFDHTPITDEPMPYCPTNPFLIGHDVFEKATGTGIAPSSAQTGGTCCFWCCHPVGAIQYGLPMAHDIVRNHFTVFGQFCSLECASAYNFEAYSGSDRSWEIFNWIQLLASQLGLPTPVRPAPNRYLLQMFNGPMSIDDFRETHRNMTRTYVMNVPPFLHVHPQLETVNTSYLTKTSVTGGGGGGGAALDFAATDKPRLYRKKSVVDNHKTLDAKMNLRFDVAT